jgi:hypothetical protein
MWLRCTFLLALVGCGRPRPETKEWCDEYVSQLRHNKKEIPRLAESSTHRQLACHEIFPATDDPGIQLAERVCSDAHGDDADAASTRGTAVNQARYDILTALLAPCGDDDQPDVPRIERAFDALIAALGH